VCSSDLYAAARLGLAEAYDKAGRTSDALEQFRAIMKLSAANLEILDRAGELAARAGQSDEAKKVWQRALNSPGDSGTKKRIRRKLQKLS